MSRQSTYNTYSFRPYCFERMCLCRNRVCVCIVCIVTLDGTAFGLCFCRADIPAPGNMCYDRQWRTSGNCWSALNEIGLSEKIQTI